MLGQSEFFSVRLLSVVLKIRNAQTAMEESRHHRVFILCPQNVEWALISARDAVPARPQKFDTPIILYSLKQRLAGDERRFPDWDLSGGRVFQQAPGMAVELNAKVPQTEDIDAANSHGRCMNKVLNLMISLGYEVGWVVSFF